MALSSRCVPPAPCRHMNRDDGEIRPMPLAAGMLLGAVVGFALWIATDTFAFFPSFLGVGLALGLMFGGMRRT